jgi:hypothetical protein
MCAVETAWLTTLGFSHRNLRCQRGQVFIGQSERKLIRKAPAIALYSLVETKSWDAVKSRQITIQNDLLPSNEIGPILRDNSAT